MSAKQFAAQMKAMIEEIKANGTAAIYCDNLIAYLAEVQNTPEAEPSAIQIERYKADLQNWIETNKYNHEGCLEMFRSVVTSGQAAIKSSFLLNGGAAVAMLAFIGHLAQFRPEKVPTFAACLMPFAYGVLAISVTSGFTYLSQWCYASTRPWMRKVGFAFNMLCILFGLSSYGFFLWGVYDTNHSFIAYA
ncbi:hypothetical protein [Methylococcus capsulatus]|jgi:hypothetical protein|uniref:Uncharacterized protein n=1 Tax=Methylococcus capsulatus TaxID=414 RepID=A0AA35UCJ8_METCP|nr:hypothetical protein [Methylococcus capsulatus]CAI8841095.1 membrane protein of unknown function [Methylococcus capsulatus]